MTMLIVVIK